MRHWSTLVNMLTNVVFHREREFSLLKRKICFIKETLLQRVQLTQEAANTILLSISEYYHKIHEIWISKNEEGSHHGLLGSVTHDLPENIKQNYTIFPSVCSILRKNLMKSKSYAWSQDIIKHASDTFSSIVRWKYGQHVCNFLSSIESHDHIGIIALSVTAPIYRLSSVYLTRQFGRKEQMTTGHQSWNVYWII